MLILAIMMLGVLIGLKFNLKKTLKANGIIQMILTGILIFCMGVSLGNRENFFNELMELGWKSVIYMLVAVVFSVLVVYVLTKIFLVKGESRQRKSKEDEEV